MKFENKFVGPNIPRAGNPVTRWIGDMVIKGLGWTIHGKLPDSKQIILIGGPHTSNWDLFLALGTMLALGVKVFMDDEERSFLLAARRLVETPRRHTLLTAAQILMSLGR